ncbi:hypothetical protein FWP30_25060 [Vibrio parahaemolyticus]|nr:hypothetical protein [Vibrio parahaemolyticus]
MSQYLIEPEVPGGFGKNTLGRFDVHPPIVKKLHLEFDGWLGDDLLETFPCFLVSEHLATALVASKLSGYNLEAVELSTSDMFQELQSERCLPRFSWLQITGHSDKDDFSVSEKGILLVSRKAMQLLQKFQLTNADITVYKS